MKILVLHASFDGQTERIAERIGTVLRAAGHVALVCPSAKAGDALADCEAIVVGAAIRYGHHSRALEKLVRAHRPSIESRPNAFFSVCLSAGGPGAKPAEARRYVDDFRRATGWEPAQVASIGGALQYSRYNFFIRILMRLIVGMAGGDTDTSRDYEYTDWQAVERFAREFAARLKLPVAA
jgi:menaquinone-dependent protoporphyrinogen oxidase